MRLSNPPEIENKEQFNHEFNLHDSAILTDRPNVYNT